MHDIHTIAERYLRDLETGRVSFYAPAEKEEVISVTQPITERVVIMREEAPHYLVGVKPSGRPVFTHCLKLAASYNSNSEKLAQMLCRLKTYDIPVQTMPACWFSNHQHQLDE
jgi:hypothetical protein